MQFAISARFCTFDPGELAEWSIAAVLKTVELLKVPGVRIPSSPPSKSQKTSKRCKLKVYGVFYFLQKSK
jgi:hypothetical protein